MTDIQQRVDKIADQQKPSQFGEGRYALLFKPGKYNLNLRVGFYTQVLGLGPTPDSVLLKGSLNSTDRGNVTTTFWRAVENLAIEPSGDRGNCYWAVSQGTELRRFHVKGNLWLFTGAGGKEWASGGFLADSHVDGKVVPGSQQQWLSRNAEWGNWSGGVWNMVFVGIPSASNKWPPQTAVEKAPVTAEKPYLYLDEAGNYAVMVPNVVSDSAGSTWLQGNTAGKSIPLAQCYLAQAGVDTAATINAALQNGKNLIFTPGIYHLESSVNISRPGTIVLGLGYPTLIPSGGTAAIQVADVSGVRIGGLLLEAGTTNSPTLLQVGEAGSTTSHSANPTFLYDIFARVGGTGPGAADCMVTINSNDVVGDNAWLWRADHGAGVGWTENKCKNGIIVNGNNVTYYGLAVEHTEEYQTLWNGNDGRVYFYQSELPYDVPSQEAWERGSAKGFASYKVGEKVTSHEAWGIGIYSYFTAANVVSDNAIETPNAAGIKIHHMVDVHLGGKGGINHVINGAGPGAFGKNGEGFQASNFNEWPAR
ncbi:MAG: coagulation factor 5/8 type domain-containing protein [Chthoniobacterales bacterium]|nr:coagulation factor 5/8 type domain-containing protein [Chthoniobacterales bacterium]